MRTHQFHTFIGALSLATLLACSGGGGPASAPGPTTATALAYVNPMTGTFKLIKDASSSGPHLVLDLVGPVLGTAMGVCLTASADSTKVTWVDVPAGGTKSMLMANGTQFNLGTGVPIQKAVANGDMLQVALAQKRPTPAVTMNGTLIKIALDLKPGAGLAPGSVIALSVDNGRSQVLDGAGGVSPIVVTVGALTAQ